MTQVILPDPSGGRSVSRVSGDGIAAGRSTGLEITSRSGRVTVRASAVDHPEVLHGTAEILPDGTVRGHGSARVEIACPEGTDVSIGTASGRVECHGALGRVAVTATSGRVTIEEAREVEVRSSSGGVTIGRCHGPCRVTATSGAVEISEAESIDVTVSSGRVRVGRVGNASVRGGSSRVQLGLASSGVVEVRTLSGSVTLALSRGLTPHLVLSSRSGRVESEVDDGADGTIVVETSSGRIRVTQD